MPNYLPFPIGETFLLSAGPRSGKTELLTYWRSAGLAPSAYLSLTPEDAEPEFFLYRLLQSWPEIRERYEALTARLPASWGAVLGIAIAEANPHFCLLLDDLQAIEESPLLPELLALFRHFPATGRLAIASQHQIPPLTGRSLTLIGPDHPYWHERPGPEDLLRLPKNLLSMSLTTHLLGEALPSVDGRELVRRNIAVLDDDLRLQLRTPWRAVAEEALALTSLDGLWDLLEEPIKTFHQAYYCKPQEQRLQAILDRIPRAVLDHHPYFLQLQGDLRLYAGQVGEARIYYQQALSQAQDQPERQANLFISLAQTAQWTSDLPECQSMLERFERLGLEATPLQRARIGNLKADIYRFSGELAAAKAASLEVIDLSTTGDRFLAYEHVFALNLLAKLEADSGEKQQANRYANQASVLATEYHLQRILLGTSTQHLLLQPDLDEAFVLPIRRICEISHASFHFPTPPSTYNLLYVLGIRADHLGEATLAERYFSWAKRFAKSHDLSNDHSNLGLLSTYRTLQRFEEARQVYSELRQSPSFEAHRSFVQVHWALALSEARHFQEAEELLEAELACRYPESIQAKVLLNLHFVRHLGGDTRALAAIQTLLNSTAGSQLRQYEGRLLQRLGLGSLPPAFKIHTFGPLSFQRDDQPPLHWPRKKPLSLLGHLVLNPTGITSEHLAEELFGDPEDMESLHTVTYRLRQGLKDAEASDLPEANRGTYRLRWERIAFCDLHEFDALYGKAQALETEGIALGAALFYGMALRVARGPLFENLPKEFEEARQRYARRVQNAREFLQAHRILGLSDL